MAKEKWLSHPIMVAYKVVMKAGLKLVPLRNFPDRDEEVVQEEDDGRP